MVTNYRTLFHQRTYTIMYTIQQMGGTVQKRRQAFWVLSRFRSLACCTPVSHSVSIENILRLLLPDAPPILLCLFIRRNHRYYENVRLPMHHLLYSLFGCSANCKVVYTYYCIASALNWTELGISIPHGCQAPFRQKYEKNRSSHLMYRPASADS